MRDLEERHHSFTFLKLDANNYLLPQRRNRVFGCSTSTASGTRSLDDVASENQTWKMLLNRLGTGPSQQQFSLKDMLRTDLPAQPLQAPQDITNWKLVQARVKRASNQDPTCICMHLGSSEKRLEFMKDASTCIRPSHDIYCSMVDRPLHPQEMLKLQGSFECDFPCPDELRSLPDTLARDLAGNAFPTPCLQAALISSMVCHQTWKGLATHQDFQSAEPEPRKNNRRNRPKNPKGGLPEDDQKAATMPKNNKKRPPGTLSLSVSKLFGVVGLPNYGRRDFLT